MDVKKWWQVTKEAFSEFKKDEATRLASSLAYYTAVSIAPMLVFLLLLTSFFWDPDSAEGELNTQLENVFGEQGMGFVRTILDNADRPNAGSVAGIFSLLALVWGSTNVFGQMQQALNRIWNVKVVEGGMKRTLLKRLVSFGMVLGIGFLLLVSLVLSSALSLVTQSLADRLPAMGIVWQVVDHLVSLAVFTGLFAAIFKLMPDVKVGWADVWRGALLTAVLFTIGKVVLTLYLGHVAPGSAYGAAGSVIVFLLWVYYSSLILFFGAEFAQVYTARHGSGLHPEEYAELTR